MARCLLLMRACMHAARFLGFCSTLWMDDNTAQFSETYERLWAESSATAADDELAAAASSVGVGGKRIRVVPTNGPTGHGWNDQAAPSVHTHARARARFCAGKCDVSQMNLQL